MIVVSAIQTLAVFIHSDGHDVHVMTVDVLMLVNHVWLVAISHALQVFTGDFSRLEFKNEVIKEFPQDAIDAVEV